MSPKISNILMQKPLFYMSNTVRIMKFTKNYMVLIGTIMFCMTFVKVDYRMLLNLKIIKEMAERQCKACMYGLHINKQFIGNYYEQHTLTIAD